MTPQQMAALERRVADLERRLPRGTGISTAFGATEVRTMQSGFPVELTSTFDATTGYSWEQRVLDYDTSEVVNADNPRTGAYAFTPDNNETLEVGTHGWLEPAPEAGGWILLMPGQAAAAPSVSSWKNVVRAATTANGTLATAFDNGSVVDGVTLITGDRILVKDQTSGAENGIYTVNASGAPTRATDADAGSELINATVAVSEGTVNADTIWMCTNNATITLGTTALVWVKIYPLISDSTEAGSVYNVTADNTWEDTGVSVTLPVSGTYIVRAETNARAAVTGTSTGVPMITMRLTDGTTSTNGTIIIALQNDGTSSMEDGYGSNTVEMQITVSGGTTVKLQARRNPISGGGSWLISQVGTAGLAGMSSHIYMSYFRTGH